MPRFTVIDMETGEYPNLQKIALTEKWARGFIPYEMEGFAVTEDGHLILMDECGQYSYCPEGRFKVVIETEE